MATKAKESSKQPTTAPTPTITVSTGTEAQLREEVFEVFRRWGYLQATLDPLKQYLPAEPFPVDLPEGSDAIAAEARGYYDLFLDEARRFSAPIWSVPGNHENFGIERHLSLVSPTHPLYGKGMYRQRLGPNYYSFNYGGVHFVGLDNVSLAKPEVGAEKIAWLKKDLARFPKSAPIVVFTHRPLFDLKPEWEWFTSDGDDVMNVLAPFDNVTVLYGHIHREDEHVIGNARHLASRSLIFAFPDPEKVADKKPNPFDKESPFKNLGYRVVEEKDPKQKPAVTEVELTLREFTGSNGIQQFSKRFDI